MKYTLYVDETGDTGLNKVRNDIESKGASPFLVFGGALIPETRSAELRDLLKNIRTDLVKKELHCAKLKHAQIAKYAREVRDKAGILLFAFVSKKETLGGYKKQIEGPGQDQKFYNKCVLYFLERIGHWMLENDIGPHELDIVFEQRDGHDYQKLRNYISTVQGRPNDNRSRYFLEPILAQRIRSVPKKDEELLEFADLVAFAVSAAINPSRANFGVPEQRYLRELKSRFFCDQTTGVIGEYGLKLFKRKLIGFDAETKKFMDGWHQDGNVPTIEVVK